MFKLRLFTRCRLIVLTLVLSAGLHPAHAQQGRIDVEVQALRERVRELEARNAAILDELADIRRLLETGAAGERPSGAVQVATTGTVDPGTVVRAMETPAAAVLPPAVPQTSGPLVTAEGNGSQIEFYGFVRIDAIFDDSRADAFQTPTFIRSEPAGAPSDGNLTIHPRLSRFGMNFRTPGVLDSLGDAALTGRIEADFQNGGRESRAVPRMRHAYLRLEWGRHSLLAGQTSDLISPLFPAANGDTLMWNAGNLGDRRMQIRYAYAADSGFGIEAGIGAAGAVSPLDADGNGIRDGEAAVVPNIQGRVSYDTGQWTMGAWSHYGRMHTDAPFGGRQNFNSYSYGADFDLRFNSRVRLRGEAWAGSNLGDMRGGIGQFWNGTTGREIDSRGGWAEVGLQSGPHGLFAGYTVDDVKNQHIRTGDRTENRAWYLTNRFNLADPLTLGIDYIHWRTHFKGQPKGTDNRIDLYLIYGF